MTKTLKQRAVRSGSWVIFGHLFSQALRLGSNLILTRLLVPEMFGVMAIVTVIMAGLAMFSDVGLLQNIVQSERGEEPDYLNTAWMIQILRGFVIFFIALALSITLYYLGSVGYLLEETVYGNAELPKILAIVSITSVIAGFNSIHILLLNRKLMMGKLTIINLVSQLIGLIFMLMWAWYQRDIWALVFGGIVSSVVKMLLSHSLNLGEKCQFCWDKMAVHEIFHFGKWIFIASILGFMLNQGDRLLLGGLVNSEVLGIYTIAFFLANALKDVARRLISSVFFPVLSEVAKNRPDDLKVIYYNTRQKIDAIVMLAAGFLFATSNWIIEFLYDERYSDAGWMLQILSLSLIGIGSLLASQCFLAKGKPGLETFLILVQTVYFYVAIPNLFYLYGMVGAIMGIALSPIVRLFLSMYLMNKYVFFDFKKEISMLPLVLVGFLVGTFIKGLMI